MAACAVSEQPCSAPHSHQDHCRDGEDQDPPLYCTDEFRIYYMKVLPCSKRYCHDWTTCPFAHPGEKARRRDPRTNSYTGIACPDMKKDGVCVRGELCPYAHNVFEYWLHPTRYRTQLCNDGTSCKRRVCFFAHTLAELRVPSSKPFVNPQALAAATAAAGARRSGISLEALANDIARARGGQPSNAGAAELANRLAGLQLQQQQQATQQQQQPQQGDQSVVLMQLLGQLLQQQQQQAQAQQQMQQAAQAQPGMEGLDASQLAALYQTLGASGGPALQQPQQVEAPALSHPDDILSALTQHDPQGQLVAQLLETMQNGGVQQETGNINAKHIMHATPRSSLDLTGPGGFGGNHSEYTASARSSFDLAPVRTPRSSVEMHPYSGGPRSSFDVNNRGSFESGRVSCDMGAGASSRASFDSSRPSFESGGGGSFHSFHKAPPFLQETSQFEAAPGGALHGGQHQQLQAGALAFNPNGGYLLSRASAAAQSAALASSEFASLSGGYADGPNPFASQGGVPVAFGNGYQRSASLPTYLSAANGGGGPGFTTMPGLDESAPYVPRPPVLQRQSSASGSAEASQLPPRAPGSRSASFESGLDPLAARASFQQHLMGALPGSFNSGAFGGASAFQDAPLPFTSLARNSASSHGSGEGSLFANLSMPLASDAQGSQAQVGSRPGTTSPSGSRPSSGAALAPPASMWAAALPSLPPN